MSKLKRDSDLFWAARGFCTKQMQRSSEGNKAHVKGSVGHGIVTQLEKLLMFVSRESALRWAGHAHPHWNETSCYKCGSHL